MSYFLMPNGLASSSPLIKASERQHFSDALALLESAEQKASTADAAYEAARAEGYEQGLLQAQRDTGAAIATETEKLALAVAEIRSAYEARVAEAAFAAASAIVGALDDCEAAARIVEMQLARRNSEEAVKVHVAPATAEKLSDRLGLSPAVEIISDPALPPTACRIVTGEGRIMADLSLQLETLRQRWGLAFTEAEIAG
jgi:flagellar biosynthesis/type III secretory pathway protein FliH